MRSILSFFLLAIRRDKLIFALFIIILASSAISVFFGSTAISEQTEMTSSYIASSSRFAINLGIIFFIITHISKLFINKEIEFILSKPISRKKFICAYTSGIFILSFFLCLLPLPFLLAFGVNKIGLLYWFATMVLEATITGIFAMLLATFCRTQVIALLSGIMFYVGARMMGLFYMSARFDYEYTGLSSLYKWLPQKIMYVTSVVLPRFDLFSQTNWLIYGNEFIKHTNFIFIQSLLYIIILHFAAFYDIENKEF